MVCVWENSYLLSVVMLLAVGLSIVMMEWLYVRNRGYSSLMFSARRTV